ncbi:MAG: hypothetical protein LBF97_03260 [Elusimicrobiota bacterium]|jgi:hypothetical protein|nr:hypothetical protein [Elusimicrobiota bacterium]
MKIICESSYYKFYPKSSAELNNFEYSVSELVQVKDYWTFKELANLENYSIKAWNFQDVVATKNYCGRIEDVLFENKIIFELKTKQLKNLATITDKLIYYSMDYIFCDILPQAGYYIGKQQLRSFWGYFDARGSGKWTITRGVIYE